MKYLFLGIFILISGIVSSQVTMASATLVSGSAGPALPSGCIAYYEFENNTDDEQGNYDGTLINDATYDSDSVQCGTYSLILDGTDDAFNCGAVNTTNDFTVAMWVNLEDRSQNIYFIANKSGTGLQDGWSLRINSDDEKIQFYASDGSSFTYLDSETSGFEYDQWVFIVVTVSKTDDDVTFYLDNIDITPTTNSIGDFDFDISTNNLYIGAITNLSWECIGYFDEVMIFNEVLTTTEISALYTNKCLY